MVSFEAIIKSLELRDVLLRFLEHTHGYLKNQGIIDMDQFQKRVHDHLPKYDFQTALATLVVSVFFWAAVFLVLHYLIVLPLMSSLRKSFPSTRYFLEMSAKDKMWYTSHIHGSVHAIISMMGSIYCFIYADGQQGTTWFHCNYYKLHTFDIQRYLNTVSAGYLVYDVIFITLR